MSGDHGDSADGVPARADRPPPFNIEAEQGTIGSALLKNDLIPALVELAGPDDFFRESHRLVWRAVVDMHAEGRPVDATTLAEELSHRNQFEQVGGDDLLAAIFDGTPHAENGRYYAGIVREHALKRRLIERAQGVLDQVYANGRTAAELIRNAEEGIATIAAPAGPDAGEEFQLRPWPDTPGPAAWHGLAGDIVARIAPHTEADPVAILGQFLVAFGNVVGRKPHWSVNATRHGCNLFLCVVGNSAKARKGTSWDIVRWLFRGCDTDWSGRRILGGLSSGEGLIWSVRDPIYRREKQGSLWQEIQTDPGEPDKRALFVESEFGATLAVLGREGNTLSGYIRRAWDSGTFESATKNNPARTTGAHVSIIGHVTNDELHRRLTETDAANGFGNRFLWVCARRSRYLPNGGDFAAVDWSDVARRLNDAVAFARGELDDDESFLVTRDREAQALWEEAYRALSEPPAGLFGALVCRAEAQVMRLAMVYALLDQSPIIRAPHLNAALAFWRYCEQSAAYIFGDSMGVPNADKVLDFVTAAGNEGASQTQILRKVFSGRQPREPRGGLAEILTALARSGMIESALVETGGRKATLWMRATRG